MKKTRSPKMSRACSPLVQPLEQRILRSATLGDFGILTINGTARNDRIAIYLSERHPERLWVKINNKVSTFNKADVLQIQVAGKAGHDRMEMNETNGPLSLEQIVWSGDGGYDTIVGGGQKDVMQGASGNDALNGNGGADNIHGGDGNDVLDGGNGNDRLMGENGFDAIRGGADDDQCYGYADQIIPDVIPLDGEDRIDGGSGKDTVVGNAGRDTLTGGAHNDSVDGGGGNDIVGGGNGIDSIRGGTGADRFSSSDAASEYLDFHGNEDFVL